jgi:hypothetical protein
VARFAGEVGYGENVVTAPGVSSLVITEVKYFGDIVRNSRHLQEGDKVNADITLQNSISIVADAYALQHFFAIRYVRWAGVLWSVTDVQVQRPRLILRLGGVYNGPTG